MRATKWILSSICIYKYATVQFRELNNCELNLFLLSATLHFNFLLGKAHTTKHFSSSKMMKHPQMAVQLTC